VRRGKGEQADAYEVRRAADGTVTVRTRLAASAETLPDAFAAAAEQFLDEMTGAGWAGAPVTSGIRISHFVVPGGRTP
jgi:hypothetical protein